MMVGCFESSSTLFQGRAQPFIASLRHRLLLCLTIVVIFSALLSISLFSVSIGLTVFGSFVAGFVIIHGLFGPQACLSEKLHDCVYCRYHFQGFLSHLRTSNLLQHKRQPTSKCSICLTSACDRCEKKRNQVCSKLSVDEPRLVPAEVDGALEEILQLTLEKYIYFWHQDITEDDSFLYEVKDSIRCMMTMLLRRSQSVDLSTLITRKLLCAGLSHLDCCLQASQNTGCETVSSSLEDAIFDYYGGDLHVAVYSRTAELRYLHGLCDSVLPYLLPSRNIKCSGFTYLIRELFGSTILLSVMDLVADPVIVNSLLVLLFDKTPITRFPPSSSKMVQLLGHFVGSYKQRSQSKLGDEVCSLLTQRRYLYPFMKFLKNEGSVGILQFCLAVEDFNDKLLNPDLKDEDMRSLHLEAKKLYEIYMSPHGVDRLNFDKEVVEEFRMIVEGSHEGVVKLRTTEEFYKAYKYALNLLEWNVPVFRRSEEYFEHLCGPRIRGRLLRASNTASLRKSNYLSTAAKIGNKINKIRGVLMPVSAIEGRIEDDMQSDMADAGFEADEMKIDTELDDLSLRDLSAWRISIPKVDLEKDENGKQYFAFVIDVQRIDVIKNDNSEENHWVVKRKYQEFYVLESKLTEFHGEFVDIHLPVKRSFGAKGWEYMESRRAAFEEFLQRLLQKPIFRGSELLFTFLSSTGDFTKGILPDIKLGRIIKNVPMKLVKERGQHLEYFLQNFVTSTEVQKTKSNKIEYKDVCTYSFGPSVATCRLHRSIFSDNAGKKANHTPTTPPRSKSVLPHRNLCDYLLYLWLKVVEMPRWSLHFVLALFKCFGSPLEAFAESYLESQIRQALIPPRIVILIHLLKDAVFAKDTVRHTDEERAATAEEALLKAKAFLPRIFVRVIGQEKHDTSFEKLFELVQQPRLNKQLLYTLLDLLVLELFPELKRDYDDDMQLASGDHKILAKPAAVQNGLIGRSDTTVQ